MAEDTARRQSVSGICDQLGLSYDIVDAIKCSPGPIGCGLSHLKALRSTTAPALILEDDIGVSAGYAPVIDVPDDADAVWLGASIYGALSLTDYVGFEFTQLLEEADHGLLRAHNLLTTHAILYLTDRFRTAAIEAITESIVDRSWDPDRALARIQSDYNVYVVRELFFYQAKGLQRYEHSLQEDRTRVTLAPTDQAATMLVVQDGVARTIKPVRTERGLDWSWV
jgi:hypothetical protein